jgi:hypothetical protein
VVTPSAILRPHLIPVLPAINLKQELHRPVEPERGPAKTPVGNTLNGE